MSNNLSRIAYHLLSGIQAWRRRASGHWRGDMQTRCAAHRGEMLSLCLMYLIRAYIIDRGNI